MENKRILHAEASHRKIKKLVDRSTEWNTKNPQNMQEWPTCLPWEIIWKGYKINKPLSGLLVYRRIMPSGSKIVRKISQLPSKLYFLANRAFFHTIFQPCLGIILRCTVPVAKSYLFTKHMTKPEARNFHQLTFSFSLMDPLPRMDIFVPVFAWSLLKVLPLGPSNFPTKLNCEEKKSHLTLQYTTTFL